MNRHCMWYGGFYMYRSELVEQKNVARKKKNICHGNKENSVKLAKFHAWKRSYNWKIIAHKAE